MPPTARDYLRKTASTERLQQLDLLTYQIQELRAANLSAPDEFEQLELERQRLGHVVELQQLSYKSTRRFTKTIATPQQGDLLGQAESTLSDGAI